MLKRVMLSVVLAAMMVSVTFASGTVVIDANGKVVGPLGHSATVAQGVVVNANNSSFGQTIDLAGNFVPALNFWLLIPWNTNGLGYGVQGWQALFGNQLYFPVPSAPPPSDADCLSTPPYMLQQLAKMMRNIHTQSFLGCLVVQRLFSPTVLLLQRAL